MNGEWSREFVHENMNGEWSRGLRDPPPQSVLVFVARAGEEGGTEGVKEREGSEERFRP
jgi:hypothetical protein